MGKKSQPDPPDYKALAEQTAASDREAALATTKANRPNQTDVYGNKSVWDYDPETGRWSQTQTLSEQGQQSLNKQMGLQADLLDQASDQVGQGLPSANLEGVRSRAGLFNMDPSGNAQAIQDATYKLISPQREIARQGEIQRLKNQGLTEDSPAFQRAMERLDQGDTDAQLKSLLAGTQEYGNQFNRGLAQNQSNFSQFSTAEEFANQLRGSNLGDIARIISMQGATNPQFGQVMSATGSGGTDYLGAGKQTFQDMLANSNAQRASANNTTTGLFGLAAKALPFFL